jgi:hypothetical protein
MIINKGRVNVSMRAGAGFADRKPDSEASDHCLTLRKVLRLAQRRPASALRWIKEADWGANHIVNGDLAKRQSYGTRIGTPSDPNAVTNGTAFVNNSNLTGDTAGAIT